MTMPAQEPRRIIPALAPFYDNARDFSWLLVRLTAGGFLLIHGIQKLTLNTIAGFAANSLARRGIEPSVPLAYAVFFLETVGALCIMFGLFTRLFAALIGVQFLIIVFVAHWGSGFADFPWNRPRRRLGISAVLGSHHPGDRVARWRPLFAGPEAWTRTLTDSGALPRSCRSGSA